jgi:hypothetical protein
MKSKYFPKKYAGKDIGLEGRILGVVGLAGLAIMIPQYAIAKTSSKLREILTGRNLGDTTTLEEYVDTAKLCLHTILYGKIPEAEEKESGSNKRLGDYW